MHSDLEPKLLDIQSMMSEIFGDELHKKRQLSLSYAAMGLLKSDSLFLHDMGRGMANARQVNKKHATKQIDRLLSNPGFDIWELSSLWVPYVVGSQKDLLVALDWSSFDGDSQHQLSLNVLSSQGSSTPLLWKTVEKSQLKYNRGRYEDQLLSRLKAVLPHDVQVTLVADRGFAAHKFFAFLENELKFNYVIRIKSNTLITDNKGQCKKASQWLEPVKITRIKQASITREQFEVAQVVCVKDKGMKAAWYLASNLTDKAGRALVTLYSKRWKIEPYFRDVKDKRFGYGLQHTHIKSAQRRDRLFLLVAICYRLLIILGQAGEQAKLDYLLKVNTVKTRTHSLFTQGKFYYEFFTQLKLEQQKNLLFEFEKLLNNQNIWCSVFDN